MTAMVTLDMVWSLLLLVRLCLPTERHRMIFFALRLRFGSRIFLCSRRGTGGLTRAVPMRGKNAEYRPMAHFCFRR